MSEPLVLRLLHRAAIRIQLPLVMSAIPMVAALYGIALAPRVVDVALPGIDGPTAQAALLSARVVVVTMTLCVIVTTIGAALLLRGSIRSVVQQIHAATGAIARGDFQHRVAVRRRDELGDLAGSIDAMAERLQQLERARRQLLACVSHELRTPLTIIQGQAFTLARSEAASDRLERLELVQAESMRLARIIDDLIEASSLHAGSVRLSIERRDLRTVLRSAAERFRDPAGEHGIEVRLRLPLRPLTCDIDAARIEQVVGNLLANAIRHADRGSCIDIALDGERGRTGSCVISVANVGEAIPASLAATLFEPFAQGSDRSGRVGLGLAIAHGLVSAHGGTLELDVEPARHGRVTFRASLPRRAAQHRDVGRQGAAWQRVPVVARQA